MLSPSAKAEIKVLESWKEEYRQQLQGLENAGENESFQAKWQVYRDFKPEEAWQKFDAAVNASQRPATIKRPTLMYYLAGAASLILVFGFWWLSRTTTDAELPVQYQAGKEAMELNLNDASYVVLDSFSNLKQTGYRQVNLSGRAFFNVAKDEKKQFVIRTPEASVTVLGTAFHVVTKNGKTRVDVTEGLVKISLENSSVLCKAGESAEVYDGRIYPIKQEENIAADWKSNILEFDNVLIEDVIKTIAFHYQVELRLENPASGKECFIKTKFVNAGIQDVLKEISMIARLEYTLQKNVLTVTRMGC